MKIEGIIPAIITPMDIEENVDLNTLEAFIKNLMKEDIGGIFALGTTGEFYSLSEREKEKIIHKVVETVNGELPVYVGTGGITTRDVISLNKKVEKMGVTAVSVITPYFITPNQEELYEHYKNIAKNTDLSIILYNIPMRTGVNLEPNTVSRLSRIKNIIGIKDSSGNIENIKKYIKMTEDDFNVLAGTDSLILESLKLGGRGAIAATANVIPDIVCSIYKEYQEGNIEKALEFQNKVNILRGTFKLGTAPVVIKEAVNARGINVGPTRMPVSILNNDKIEKIKNTIEEIYR